MKHSDRASRIRVLRSKNLLLALLITGSPSLLAAQQPIKPRTVERRVEAPSVQSLRIAAEASKPGDRLRIEAVPLFDGPLVTLELENFRLLHEEVLIEVHGSTGTGTLRAPDTRLFRGRVEHQPDSLAFIAVFETGEVTGLISDDDRVFTVSSSAVDGATPVLEFQQISNLELRSQERPFQCGNEAHPTPLQVAELLSFAAPAPLLHRHTAETRAAGPDFAVDVAIETDHEFYQLFGSASGATAYIQSLFGAIATIYERDVDTQLQIPYISLWETSSDPWNDYPAGIDANGDGYLDDPEDTPSSLMQLRDYWNANRTATDRTITHFLRGRSAGFGVAYVGALCSRKVSLDYGVPSYNYAYGLTTSISGSYSSPATPVWDLVAVAHEIGHNFNSPHTHCYNVYTSGGPVDECYSGDRSNGQYCYQGPTSVPADGGTIMSYCHLKSPGMSNINLWFGREGYYGTNSERVNERMLAHLASSQASDCLAEFSSGLSTIFEDGFETGTTSAWQ